MQENDVDLELINIFEKATQGPQYPYKGSDFAVDALNSNGDESYTPEDGTVFSFPGQLNGLDTHSDLIAGSSNDGLEPDAQGEFQTFATPINIEDPILPDAKPVGPTPQPQSSKSGTTATPASAQFTSPYYKQPSSTGIEERPNKSSKRLARKAALARASRRRKKQYVQNLEAKVRRLESRIEELERRFLNLNSNKDVAQQVNEEEKQRQALKRHIEEQMQRIIESKQAEEKSGELAELLKQYVQTSKDRQFRIDYFLNRVKDSLTPGLQVKFAIWSMTQDQGFYARDQAGLWDTLMRKEIRVSEEQEKRLLSERALVAQERRNLLACDKDIERFQTIAREHLNAMHEVLEKVGSNLSSLQLAKFLVW
eukprot:CAMPEP_0114506114 /NCGR_PEP_ID=MMETSP0109-20121206/11242_1 /TAXON_ID=29199 /ORGANISM="Chlorarachnion reptans, Strain CCCM449" /LENGTH=367 /DNA_ID=CAMNT_0001684655 /DNA_START=273 /DNA_END=1373 /DNA_ORIENTATION=-